MEYLPCVEVEPSSPATAAVIWLHGLGADGHDFEPIVPQLGLDGVAAVRFVFPHAPAIPVTINNGYVMPAWYDILEMDLERKVDETQLRASA
ncbi:MAG: carboxylesterase, partial [Proteobacteria bacterium]|nr:carboxylesterase [Pseudomonadota bacterium]